MSVHLVLVVKGMEEYVVIDTQDLDDDQFKKEYGDRPTQRIWLASPGIDLEVSSWPTDRELMKS
jgi:hypothetical protein